MRHNRSVVNWFASMLAASVLVSLAGAPTSAVETAEKRGGDRGSGRFTDLEALRATAQAAKASPTVRAPRGANPYLALLPNPNKADYAGWRAYMEAKAAARSPLFARQQRVTGLVATLDVRERERHARPVRRASGRRRRAEASTDRRRRPCTRRPGTHGC